MPTLIFVYSSAQFRITGGTIDPFPGGTRPEITATGEVTLGHGIYLAVPDPKASLNLEPMQGIVGTDYDSFQTAGKDIPPDLQLTMTLGAKVLPGFSSTSYNELRMFVSGRGV
jgi:hypothetical protein